MKNVPSDILQIVNRVEQKIRGKKVILYQGVFSEDRHLDEFCEAMNEVPDDYIFLLMGKHSAMYEDLKRYYSSDKVIFLPFIKPPYHLLITQKAHIGVLSYIPQAHNLATVINPLYCAPNKIFEYARYSIPMIANDIPGLKYVFMEYNCGACLPDTITSLSIRKTLMKINREYDAMAQGAYRYYQSVNVLKIIERALDFH